MTAKATLVLDHRVTIEILLLRLLLYWNQDVGFLTTRRSKIGPVILGKRPPLVPKNQGVAEGLHLFVLILQSSSLLLNLVLLYIFCQFRVKSKQRQEITLGVPSRQRQWPSSAITKRWSKTLIWSS